jgi:dienelactone hydrolase
MKFAIRAARVASLSFVASFFAPTVASADVVEEVFKVPVTVDGASGRPVSRDVVTTVVRDTANRYAPLLILSHGRSAGLETMPRVRYPQIAKFFVEHGYLVVMPTRIGYGPTGGPDVETRGRDCAHAEFAFGFRVAADETQQVIDWAVQRDDVDASHIVAVGMSYGGAATLALAARNPDGLVAAVNFSGGSGGDKDRRPGDPCNPERVAAAYETFGKTTHVPELWLYSTNDLFWGSDIPKAWFARYRKAGAPARFLEMPPVGDNGHQLMTNGQDLWRAEVLRFLADPAGVAATTR